jgi:hypothetical protein
MKAISSLALILYLPTVGLSQQVDPQTAWGQFTAANGQGWSVEWNQATGTPSAMFGPGLKLGAPVADLDSARVAAAALLTRYSSLLGKGDSEFIELIGAKAQKVFIFVYDQKFRGLDVISGRADVRINEIGVVAMFGSSAVAIPAGFGVKPRLTATAAKAIAEGSQLGAPSKRVGLPAPRLVIWADTASPAPTVATLAWEVQIDERPVVKVGKVYVDAIGGKVLQFENEVFECGCGTPHVVGGASRHAAEMARSADLAKLTGPSATGMAPAAPMALTGKVMAWTNTGHLPTAALKNVPMANLLVTSSAGSAFTDANGNFSIAYTGTTAVPVTATLTGRHSKRVRVVQGTQMSASASVTPGTSATIQLGTSTMGQFDRAQTTTYYFTDDVNVWLRSLLPASGAQIGRMSAVNPRVNIASSCNAYYTNFTINFYARSSTCANTAYETVVQHEWGHGIDHAFGGISQIDGLSEGWGDLLGTYRSRQPQVGPGFRIGSTTGIRTATNTRTFPAGGAVHQQGQTWMGWAWDLRGYLMTTHGAAAGELLAHKIVVASIAADATNQPRAVREVFILDDDDGNLNNGTPNYKDLEKASLKRKLPYPKRVNPNAGTYVTYGAGCKGSGKLPANCLNVNATGTPQNFGTRTGLAYALLATAPAALQVKGFELYTSGSQTLTTRIYAATTSGRPGTVLGTSTIVVGAAKGWYKTTFASAIAIASGRKFFISFQNNTSAANISASIRAGTNVTYFRNDGAGGAWSQYGGFPWAYKVNCLGGAGAIPTLANAGVPEINRSFALNLSRGKPSTNGFLLAGASDSSWLGQALPWDLSPFGATGCKVLASGDLLLPISTNAVGTSSSSFNLPNSAALFGVVFFNQYALNDTANGFGIVLSNAGKGKIGKQ